MKKSKIRRIEMLNRPLDYSHDLYIFKFCTFCNCTRKHREGRRYFSIHENDFENPCRELVHQQLSVFCECLTCKHKDIFENKEKYIDMIKNE